MLAFLLLLAVSGPGQPARDFSSLSLQAARAREADQVDQAVQLYREALQLRPEWAEGLWYLGTLSYDRQQFSQAALTLSHLIQIAPQNANAFAMLGLSEVKINQNKAALDHLTFALKLGLGDEANLRSIVAFNQAVLLLNKGEFGQAQMSLDLLAQQTHNPGEDLLAALGRSVLGISSTNPPADLRHVILAAGRAEMLAANRETEPAHAAYADLTRQFPKVHNVEFAYGRFLLNNHLDDAAVAAFKREIVNSPQHLLARLGIAGVLLRVDPNTSVIYAQEAVKLAPKLEEAHYLLGAALLANDQPKRAISELESAQRLRSDDPRVYFALGKAYQGVHRESDAAQARARFLQLNASRR